MLPAITRQEALIGLYAAWRLFLRDKSAVALLDNSIQGFWKSFWCAVIVLPIYVPLVVFGRGGPTGDAGFFRIVAVEAIAYVIGWVAWPLLMSYLAPAIDKNRQYIRYIVAYNWSAGPQAAVLLAVVLLGVTGFLPTGFAHLLSLVALIVLLVYHFFILRVVLEADAFAALALVIGEFMLSQVIIGIRTTLLI